MKRWETKKILIWGKTNPELSSEHDETVCTGGCLEDGSPVRLYPIRFRYLAEERKFKLYDWIKAPIRKSLKDGRPESYKIKAQNIERVRHIGTDNGWAARREIIFKDRSWHFACLDELKKKQQKTGRSLGVVKAGDVKSINLKERSEEERQEHLEKLRALQAQKDMFGREVKDLDFLRYRVRIAWECDIGDSLASCPGNHTATVFDWGLYVLGRREGKDAMLAKMEEICNLGEHDLHFFMGNLNRRRHIFTNVGLWYPLKRDMRQRDMFISR